MSELQDRLKVFEAKYAIDEGMKFRLIARRNKLMGLYIGDKLGKSGEELEVYAKAVVASDMKEAGDSDIIAKIMADLAEADMDVPEAQIAAKLTRLTDEAKEQLAIEE